MSAIWFPLISRDSVVRVLYSTMAIIALMAFLLPSNPTGFWHDLSINISSQILNVQSMSSKSKFPFATQLTYSFSLFASFFMAFVTCLASLKLKPFYDLVEKKSKFKRFLIFIFMFLTLLIPYFVDLELSEDRFSYNFFKSVGEERFFLFLWTQGAFLFFYLFWIMFIFEVTNFLKFVFRGKHE